jgi:RNA polymerase sigma-70 factor (ECF subfamily)
MGVSMEPLSDEELVARYRHSPGSPESDRYLNELFQRHRSRVALWCLRLTGDREAAADLAQEVFLKAFRYLDSFRSESKFSTWLYSITRNHCFNEIKSRALAPDEAGDPVLLDLPDRTPGPHSQYERESDARLLRELMKDALDETETRVMNLHYVEELPLEAVTRLLQLPNSSGAKAFVVSAKRKLARAVEQWKARAPGAGGNR